EGPSEGPERRDPGHKMRQATAVRAVDMLAALSGVSGVAAFNMIVLRESAALLQADRASSTVIRHDGLTQNYAWPQPPGSALIKVWDQHHEDHPSIAALRRSPSACHQLSEQFSLPQLRKLPIYSMFMQPMGGRDQLTIALQADDRRLVGLTLARLDGRF